MTKELEFWWKVDFLNKELYKLDEPIGEVYPPAKENGVLAIRGHFVSYCLSEEDAKQEILNHRELDQKAKKAFAEAWGEDGD